MNRRFFDQALLSRLCRRGGPLLVVLLSCARRDVPEGPAPSVQPPLVQPQAEVAAARAAPSKPAPAPAPPSGVNGAGAIGIASRWLDAVRHESLEQLAPLTRYPFEVRDTGRDARCKKKVATGRASLELAVSCLLGSELLHRALTDSTSSRMLADGQPPASLADWARPWWREKDHAGLQSVYTMVATSDGYEFDFQILVDHDGVRAVWKSGSFESRN